MKTLRFALALVALPLLAACSGTPRDADDLGTNEGAFSAHFKSVVSCGGAHIDSSDPESESDNQFVVSDAGAAAYLKGKLADAMAHDPFSPNLSSSWNVKAGRADEIVWKMTGWTPYYANLRQDFTASFSLTGGNEIRADVRKVSWDQDQGNGLYRKVTDVEVRILRNGYDEVVLVPGRSGDPDSYEHTGRGWAEWEIANWTFRGCSNQ